MTTLAPSEAAHTPAHECGVCFQCDEHDAMLAWDNMPSIKLTSRTGDYMTIKSDNPSELANAVAIWDEEEPREIGEKDGETEDVADKVIGEVDGKTAKGLERALGLIDLDVRYNIRSHAIEFKHTHRNAYRKGWREMSDRDAAKVREVIEERVTYTNSRDEAKPLAFGRDKWQDCINAILWGNEIDPFKEYLDGLDKWDGVERLDSWLSLVFTVSPDSADLAAWASRYCFLGGVWRTMKPGVKLDEMPVLVGPPGVGKSTVLRHLIPADMGSLFSDALRFSADDKVRAEALQGRLICEAAEMSGATRADIDSMKAFLSRTDDNSIRLAYRRNPESMPRRCIIVGTADHAHALPNTQNLRRFVPVVITGGNPAAAVKFLDTHRAQLWAEALAMYGRGVTAWLPHELQDAQAIATETARSRNVALEETIDSFLGKNNDAPFASIEFLYSIGLADSMKGAKVDHAKERAAYGYLRTLGYDNPAKRVNGKLVRKWEKT